MKEFDYVAVNRELSLVALGMAIGGGAQVRKDIESYTGYMDAPRKALISSIAEGNRDYIGLWLKDRGVKLGDGPAYKAILEAFKKLAARKRLRNFRQQINEIAMLGADLDTISKMENLLTSMRVALLEVGPEGEEPADDLQAVNNIVEESTK